MYVGMLHTYMYTQVPKKRGVWSMGHVARPHGTENYFGNDRGHSTWAFLISALLPRRVDDSFLSVYVHTSRPSEYHYIPIVIVLCGQYRYRHGLHHHVLHLQPCLCRIAGDLFST